MTKSMWWRGAIAFALGTACANHAVEPASPASSPTAAAFASALDAYYSRALPPDEPGGAVLVMKRGRVVFSRGYGLADLETRQRVTTQTLFNTGSVSKTFVANAVLILRDAGKLSLDDDLLEYFPNFKNKQIAAQVKIKHLLTHTSGLPDNREVATHREFYLTAKDAENWYPITQADALVFEPGSQFQYSNPAFNGLALIVERLAGTKWQAFVRDKIFQPAGMKTSTITDGPHPETGVAHGYVKNHDVWEELDYGEEPTFAAAGNGGVWSSVEELALYEQALSKAVFLTPETIAESRTIKTFSNWRSPKPPRIGWSWFVRETPDHVRLVGHTGEQGGFLCNYVTIPDKQIAFFVLTNSIRSDDVFGEELMRQLEAARWLD